MKPMRRHSVTCPALRIARVAAVPIGGAGSPGATARAGTRHFALRPGRTPRMIPGPAEFAAAGAP